MGGRDPERVNTGGRGIGRREPLPSPAGPDAGKPGFTDEALPHTDAVYRFAHTAYPEVSVGLGIPVGTARSRIFRGRRLLQEALHEYAVETGYVLLAGNNA